jgi:hypothetical protein
LKEANASSPLLCNLIAEYDFMKDKKSGEIRNGWNISALTYACDVKTLSENRNTIMKNTEAQLETSIEVGIKLNTGKTNHMVMSHKQNAGKVVTP